jgi:hypothetical protein
VPEDRTEIDVELLFVELRGNGYHRHDDPLTVKLVSGRSDSGR